MWGGGGAVSPLDATSKIVDFWRILKVDAYDFWVWRSGKHQLFYTFIEKNAKLALEKRCSGCRVQNGIGFLSICACSLTFWGSIPDFDAKKLRLYDQFGIWVIWAQWSEVWSLDVSESESLWALPLARKKQRCFRWSRGASCNDPRAKPWLDSYRS